MCISTLTGGFGAAERVMSNQCAECIPVHPITVLCASERTKHMKADDMRPVVVNSMQQ